MNDTLWNRTFSRNEKVEFSSPYIIKPVKPFELVIIPDGRVFKLAHGGFFEQRISDFEIELSFIQRWEFASSYRRDVLELYSESELAESKEKLKYHYRRAIYMVSPDIAAGWNRWSEYILDLFLENKLFKVLWGSGGCGKSRIYALLRYIRWRVNPPGRMCIIASMVMKESKARVFGYLSEFHALAPTSSLYKIVSYKGEDKGIYTQILSTDGKWINNERGCIIPLPIKVDADAETFGDNLIGIHPEDALDIDIDEAQEVGGSFTNMRVFINWLSNPKVSFNVWGNPNPVSFFAKHDYDLLFKMGIGNMTGEELRERETLVRKCDKWYFKDTAVVRLSTLDSPKDDPEEKDNWIEIFGEKKHRLQFLAGQNSVDQLPAGTSEHSPAYYSQVYGFPYVDYTGEWSKGVLSPSMIGLTKSYPLLWKSGQHEFKWFMGVDSAATGKGDACSIVCGRVGLMLDGRLGVDFLNGQYCRTLYKDAKDERLFIDYVVDSILVLARELKIPLSNVGIETHSSGEVLNYAMIKSIHNGQWGNEWKWSGQYHRISPVIGPTSRWLFKTLGKFEESKDIVTDINTEYWLAVRCGVQTRQFFNIPDHILNQFYNRGLNANGNGTKYKLESKKDMWKRGVPSPNDADALCNMVEVMRVKKAFDFRFKITGDYDAYFTPELEEKKLREQVNERLGRISNVLGMGGSIGGGTVGPGGKGLWVGKGHFSTESI